MPEIGNYFIVDIKPLICHSNRPHHLERRLMNKKQRSNKDVESKRLSIIEDRKARLALKFKKVDLVVNKKKEKEKST